MALSYIISEIKQSIGRKWRFFHIRCIRRNHRGSRLNIPITFGTEKLEWCGYPLLKKSLICLPFRQNTGVRHIGLQTGGRKDRHLATAQSALCIASCRKNQKPITNMGQCNFYRAMLCIARTVGPTVARCLSLYLSITRRHCVENISATSFRHLAALHHFSYSTPNVMTVVRLGPPNGGVLCRGGQEKSRFSTNISLYL